MQVLSVLTRPWIVRKTLVVDHAEHDILEDRVLVTVRHLANVTAHGLPFIKLKKSMIRKKLLPLLTFLKLGSV